MADGDEGALYVSHGARIFCGREVSVSIYPNRIEMECRSDGVKGEELVIPLAHIFRLMRKGGTTIHILFADLNRIIVIFDDETDARAFMRIACRLFSGPVMKYRVDWGEGSKP